MSTITPEQQPARAARVAGAARASAAAGAATWAARTATWAATATAAAAEAEEVAARATAWANFDPCGLLERLIKIDNNAQEAA
jgi:hypothetical protein